MQRKDSQKAIVVAVLIILAILIIVNFNITGQAVKKQTTTEVTVTPKTVSPGDYITVIAEAGTDGMEGTVSIYTRSGLRKAEIDIRECPGLQRCLGIYTASYQIDFTWPDGMYYASVLDRGSGKYVEDAFTVKK